MFKFYNLFSHSFLSFSSLSLMPSEFGNRIDDDDDDEELMLLLFKYSGVLRLV